MVGEFSGSCGIGDVAGGMLAAVDLDRQFPCRTCEIRDTLSDRMLAAELPRATSGPQGMPQALFGIGGNATQTAGRGGRSSHWHQPPTSPRPSPPPVAERGFAPALVRMREANALAALGGGEGQGEVGGQFDGTRGVGGVAAQTACGGGRSSHWHQPPTSPRPSPPPGAEREFTPALVRMREANALAALGGGEGQGEVGNSFRIAMQAACRGGRSSHRHQPSSPRGAEREVTLALVRVCGCRAPHA